MKTLIFLSIILFSSTTFAGKIRDIDFNIDSSNFSKNNTFAITVYLIKKSGKRIVIAPNTFSIYWNKIKVNGQHISSFKHGIVTFNQQLISGTNNTCNIEVIYNGSDIKLQKPIIYPYVKGLIIKNNKIPVNFCIY